MQIGRFSHENEPRIGIFNESTVTDITDSVDSFEAALRRTTVGDEIPTGGKTYDVDTITYLPPTTSTNTVFAIALNYRSHIDETDMAIPERPLVFLKLYRSLVGHREPIAYNTAETREIDYEAELAAVIGRQASNVSEDDALDYVAGYTILNDVSARDVQRMALGDDEVLDWFSAKAMKRSTPVGPFVTTTDEITDPSSLHITSKVNGETMQDEGTHLMIRSVSELISFISTRVNLEPGDVIATGTPEGVGKFQDITLDDGDQIDISINGLGTLSNSVERI